MKRTKITVYIAAHNYGCYLEEAVESVLRQTISGWELIIIDDNSKDNTQDIIALYKNDPRISWVKTKGVGLPAVCNIALRKAKGEYIIRLDGDDVFDENILLVLSNWLDNNPDAALVFPDYYLMDEGGNITGQERRTKIFDKNHIFDIPANGACTLIRTKVLKEIGGYREDLGAQDGFDLWNKVIGKYKCGNVNLPLFYYRRHGRNLTSRKEHIIQARRAIKLDAVKNKFKLNKPVIGVIPVRENYDFCKNIWNRKLNDVSLLDIEIKKFTKSKIFDLIVVASDNPEVKKTIRKFKDKRLVYFKRDAEDTIRSKSIIITLEKIMKKYNPNYKGIAVLSYVQSPFVAASTLEEAVSTLIVNNAQSAIGVVEVKGNFYRRSGHGLLLINPPTGIKTDFDTIYRESSTSLALKCGNIKKGSLTGSVVVHYLVDEKEYFFIDTEQKLKIADTMAKEIKNGN